MLKIFKSRANTNSEEIRSLKEELNSKIAETKQLIDDLRTKIHFAERTFTYVKPFDFDDISYLSKIREIYNSNEFRFHVSNTKNVIVNQITSGDKETALLCQGMLKGIDLLLDSTYKAAAVCDSLENDKNGKV